MALSGPKESTWNIIQGMKAGKSSAGMTGETWNDGRNAGMTVTDYSTGSREWALTFSETWDRLTEDFVALINSGPIKAT
jgi:hypothetical protein